MTISKNVISSVHATDASVLESIINLHNKGNPFELDPCYSKGNFYYATDIPQPKYRFDIFPVTSDTQQADVRQLPVGDNSIQSIIFDPPFMFGTHGQTKNNIMNKRFTMFDTWNELESMYVGGLKEFHRILIKGGLLAFKCQDYTDSKTTMTHCIVYNWATSMGFYAKDIFILLSKQRIFNPTLTQRHSRKFHSYWWVFIK